MVLVKDHGVYIISEIGEQTPRDRKVVYTEGCHLDKDEAWWETAREEVGDDGFGETINLTQSMMNHTLSEGKPMYIMVSNEAFRIEC